MDLSKLSVTETKEFVASTLNLPDVAEKFEEQDVDGAVLLDLTTTMIREFVPLITIGRCVKFFQNLKAFREQFTELRNVEQPSTPTASATTTVSRSPSSSQSSPCPDDTMTSSSFEDPEVISTVQSETPPSRPLPKNFPVEKIIFAPEGCLMIRTGEVTIAGKSAISSAVVSQMLQFSSSDCYVSYEMKRMAATALVYKFPTLEMGLGTKSAVDAWHKAFSTKLSNWRKRGKFADSPRVNLMKEKYSKQAVQGRRSAVQATPKRKRSTYDGDISPDELATQDERKKVLHAECSKPARSRNMRLLDVETERTFLLRRKFVIDQSPHARDLMREWPSLKVETIMLKELQRIDATANSYAVFSARLEVVIPGLLDEVRARGSNYTKNHPLNKVLEEIPFVDQTDPDYDTDLHLTAALVGLTYVLPSTAKKTSQVHKHLIDFCPASTTQEDIRDEVEDRHQPYIQVYGKLSEVEKVIVYADKVPVCACTSMAKALYVMMTVYFLLDVEYSAFVSPALEFLQTVCLGLNSKKSQIRVRELQRKLCV